MTTENSVPILDLTPDIEARWESYTQAVTRVLRSGSFILGDEVKSFEKEVGAYLGVRHAIGVNSGTDALVIALRALGIGPGDEVIIPSFTFFATGEAVSMVGATPVFCDADEASMNLDTSLLPGLLTPRTKAIIPVHLFGLAAEMETVQSFAKTHGLKVVEDVAQAFGGDYCGRKLGTIGDIGAYSFFPSKNLGAFGDGGLVTTNDDRLAELVRKLRTHGSLVKYRNEMLGYNSRLDEIQAALLRCKLPLIDRQNNHRIEAAKRYSDLLQGLSSVVVPTHAPSLRHVFHQYTIRVQGVDRDAVAARLKEDGISTMVYYPVPLHRLPVYENMGVSLPRTELLAKEVLSLPIWPEITLETQSRIAKALGKALSN